MTYTYNDQNQVTGIVDASMTNKGFRVVPRTSTANTVDYEYDLNGNMTKDANKGIFLITYNHLDLPTRVEFGDQSPDGRMIEYMYSAGGQKLKKTVYKDGQVIKDVEYVGGIEYENTQATRIQHAEGSIVLIPEGRGHDKNNYQYEWVLRDHLGNTRVTFTNDDDDGVVKAGDISQENHYYPYGMNMEGPWNGVAGKNNYQLTGKEFENDFDLGWSDHGMRRYDPAMARWTSADPLMGVFADMSPYNYVMGNPVGLVDLDGAKSSNSNKYFANGKGGGPMTYIYTYEIQHYIWVPPVPAQAHVFNTGDGSGDAVPGYWKEGAVETFVIIDIPIEQNESGSDNLERGLPNGTAAPLGASGGGTVTGGNNEKEILQTNEESCCSGLSTRMRGGLRLLGATFEGVAATALTIAPEPTGLTKVAAVVAWGVTVDDGWTALKQIWTGEEQESIKSQALQAVGLSKQKAETIDFALGVIFTIGSATATRLLTKGGYTITKTVANNLATRPYINSLSTIEEIMAYGKGVADKSFKGGFNYKAPGMFNGSNGFFELGINPSTKVIYHFIFKSL
jgi:RHS repeat-associated protein